MTSRELTARPEMQFAEVFFWFHYSIREWEGKGIVVGLMVLTFGLTYVRIL